MHEFIHVVIKKISIEIEAQKSLFSLICIHSDSMNTHSNGTGKSGEII